MSILDNTEIELIMNKLENLEDEQLAVKLLQEFNSKSKILGELLLNMDKSLPHSEWKSECDRSQKKLDQLLDRIRRL